VPHETIRRQMTALQASVDKLVSRLDNMTYQSWQALYFSEWYCDIFAPFVQFQHEAEEEIMFPWIEVKTSDIPQKKYSKCHKELVAMMTDIATICHVIQTKKGEHCKHEIALLQQKVGVFVPEMRAFACVFINDAKYPIT
jgi:hypothetical protein